MAEYIAAVLSDLGDDDALVAIGQGLGLLHVLARRLCALHQAQEGLHIVIGGVSRLASLHGALLEAGLHPRQLPPCITNEANAAARAKLYSKPGVLLITSRILVTDLLTQRLPGSSVASMLVWGAHRVAADSSEGFILRLYREQAPTGVVQAFTEDAEMLARGFNRLDALVRTLQLRSLRIQLWPRFQATVQDALQARPAEVVELGVAMSPAAARIQAAILRIIDGLLADLHSKTGLDVSALNADAALIEGFAAAVKRALAGAWARISLQAKDMIDDLGVMHKLLTYLLQYDALTFLKYVDSQRETSTWQSPDQMPAWLLMDGADELFEAAQSRVLQIKTWEHEVPAGCPPELLAAAPCEAAAGRAVPSTSVSGPVWIRDDSRRLPDGSTRPPHIRKAKLKVERPPKWAALVQVVNEALAQWHAVFGTAGAASDVPYGSAVLVLTRDARTADQLSDVLSIGPGDMLKSAADLWIRQSCSTSAPAQARWEAAAAAAAARGQALPTQAVRARVMWELGRRCSSGASGSGATEPLAASAASASQEWAAAVSAAALGGGEPAAGAATELELGDVHAAWVARPHAAVYSAHAVRAQPCLLGELRPAFIVLYDPTPYLIRACELYKALHLGKRPLRVYTLSYENSVEQRAFGVAVAQERTAFERLIDAKALMTLPAPTSAEAAAAAQAAAAATATARTPRHRAGQDADWAAAMAGQPAAAAAAVASDSRAQAAALKFCGVRDQGKRRVVVDMREFRSKLPSLLHQAAMHVVPVTLEVADYVLSPELAFERKSPADLVQSLQSGRLYTQAAVLCREYKSPALLIEFDDKAWGFHNRSELSRDVSSAALVSKLVLLMRSFPRLRIVWTQSPRDTVQIFGALKQAMDEPDTDTAVAVRVLRTGRQDASSAAAPGASSATGTRAGQGAVQNDTGLDLLRRLPGITEGNLPVLLQHIDCVMELLELPEAALQEILGAEHGSTLHAFLHQELGA